MVKIIENNGRVAYGIKRYMVSTADEIKHISLTSNVACGSTVVVTSTGAEYILDNKRHWVKIANSGGGDTPGDEVIYEGGDLSEDESADEELDYDGGDLQ